MRNALLNVLAVIGSPVLLLLLLFVLFARPTNPRHWEVN